MRSPMAYDWRRTPYRAIYPNIHPLMYIGCSDRWYSLPVRKSKAPRRGSYYSLKTRHAIYEVLMNHALILLTYVVAEVGVPDDRRRAWL